MSELLIPLGLTCLLLHSTTMIDGHQKKKTVGWFLNFRVCVLKTAFFIFRFLSVSLNKINYFKVGRPHIHDYSARNSDNLILERMKLKCTQQSFFNKGARTFNAFNKVWTFYHLMPRLIAYRFIFFSFYFVILFLFLVWNRTCIGSCFQKLKQ